MFRVRAVQVEHGDSLLITYGINNKMYHLLVDGGPSGSLPILLSVLKQECVGGRLRLETLVVTHYDLDHIQGVIDLLNDLPPWLDIGDIWFNGYHHLPSLDILGASEGDTLSRLIRRHGIPWNASFRKQGNDKDGGAIVQDANAVSLPGGLEVRILSPDMDGLIALARNWSNAGSPPLDSELAPGDLLGRSDIWPPKEFSSSRTYSFQSDTSISNKSSIALLLTFDNKRALLAADAFSDVITRGLAIHLPRKDPIDLLKVSHHGSKGNTDKLLLETIGCKRFLISTSGKIHKHPDHALIERLVAGYDCPEIFFNYEDGWPGNWKNRPEKWPPYNARYPGSGDKFVDVFI
ncbi:hypothetical protein [Pseudomonas aeruginosa]|uniref:ComEC/Rec2 family competence protein n=1 Tax=Pseudomonas aeruginosa TaxID=287 RepID=UPI001A2B8EEC|nr:hypothetical protein [Pseudomonas aeruginosa]MBG7441583.1 hypothetical protein [Pseudomonas aeruginosa]MDU0512595.1 hypothetical protein [Pseudomonas aeruginosa]